jgi:nicotinamidase/pyrazinamidase
MVQKSALIVVDMQNDFLRGGPLAVPHADEIIPTINLLLHLPFDSRIATQDWHPQAHCSFASRWGRKVGDTVTAHDVLQIMWPDHCIQGTHGSEFSDLLDVSYIDHVVHKGTDIEIDSYSTFFDNAKQRSIGLEDYLKNKGIYELFFAGILTEYCVLYSVMDALDLGFTVIVITDAVQGLDLHYQDIEKAFNQMKEKGARFMSSKEVEEYLEHKEKIVDALQTRGKE